MQNRKKCCRDVDPSVPERVIKCRRRSGGTALKTHFISVIQPAGPPPPAEVLEPVMRDLATLRWDLIDAGVFVLTAPPSGLRPCSGVSAWPRRPLQPEVRPFQP
jgi:hypothetical protein